MTEENNELRAELYFAQIPVWILFHEDLQHSDVRVWGVLQRFAGERGICWPGYAAISELSRVSKRQVQNCIDRLEAVGALKVERRKKRVEKDGEVHVWNNTNVYTLKIIPPSMQPVSTLLVFAEDDGTERVVPVDRGQFEDQGGMAEIAIGVATVATGGIATVAAEREPYTNSNSTVTPVGSGDAGDAGVSSALSADEEKPGKSAKRSRAAEPLRDDVELLCNTLVEHLIANGVRKTKATVNETSRREARLLLDHDKVPLEEAMRILHWSQRDSFWKTIIISMKKFRDKFDQLRMRANALPERHSDSHAAADRLRALAAEAERIDGAAKEIGGGIDEAR